MEEQAPSYHREFSKSPHHAVWGLLTLGLGFLSAQLLGLIVGATAYALGLDLPAGPPVLPPLGRWPPGNRPTRRRIAESH